MDNIRVLLATKKPFAQIAIQKMEEALNAENIQLERLEQYETKEELIQKLPGVQALIVRSDKIDREIIEAAPDLKLLVRAGSGYDNVDIKAAHYAGVVVMNTPGQNANAVAELVFGMLVFGARNRFNGISGFELKGKTLGIHAFGNVGTNVARIARGFGMHVLAYDPYTSAAIIERHGVEVVPTVEDLYQRSNIISLHLPFTPQTKEVINEELISLMPRNGVIVNTARKEVINELELLKVLKQRPNMMFLTDIEPEYLDEFRALSDQFFATPKKMGAQTKEANMNAGVAAVKELIDFFKSGNVQFKVN